MFSTAFINNSFIVEFENTEAQSTVNRMHIIQNKITIMAKKFGTNDKYFPLSEL